MSEDEIEHAAELLRGGELVAFPTETVYGLGANALDAKAVARIFEVKGRPSSSPIIVHVSSHGMIGHVASSWPDKARVLAERFWPGPLTLVVPKISAVPDIVTAGLPTVGVRMPANPVALALIEAAQVPVVAPSANRFTQVSPTTAEHVRQGLGDRVDYILDGGPCQVGIESTVLSLSMEAPVLLRPGGSSRQQIEELIGAIAQAEHRNYRACRITVERRHNNGDCRTRLPQDAPALLAHWDPGEAHGARQHLDSAGGFGQFGGSRGGLRHKQRHKTAE